MNCLFIIIFGLYSSIVAHSQAINISTGQPHYGTVPKDSYVYFYFDVEQENCTILVSLTTLDDGDPDLLVSFGSNTKPTLIDAQFSSISKLRTELIEISTLDIYPLKSMMGTWTIGVYGRTAATFSLTALYEDQKTVQLKAGIPFEMYLKENFLMYFKFYHETDSDIKIKLDKFSGDLKAYVVSLQKHDNSLVNLPNETYYDWTIDTERQSTLKIQSSDECVNCLYLIGLKAMSSSKFIINILEDSKFMKAQNGIHYQEMLLPQETKPYVFTSSNADEVYIDYYINGEELRVYSSQNPTVNTTHYKKLSKISSDNPNGQIVIKKTDFVQDNIWDGKHDVPSEKNSFYFVFENPTASEVSYSFIIRAKSSNVILRPGARIETILEPKDQNSWIFYSSHDNEIIKIIIDLRISKYHETDSKEIETFLANGLPIKATYWSEGETQGEGQSIKLTRGEVMNDQISQGNVYSYKQIISTTSLKGKFLFEIENSINNPIIFGVRLFRSEVGSFSLDKNAEHTSTLEKGHSENIEVMLGHKGIWYLWAYTCSGEVEISIQDASNELELETNVVSLRQREDHLYKTYHPSGGVKVLKVTRSPNMQQDTQFYLSSSYFSEDNVYDFEPENDYYHVDYNYNYDPVNTVAYITLSPLELKDLNPSDSVVYYVRLCPRQDDNKQEEKNMCSSELNCLSFNRRFFINNQHSTIQARFDNVQQGFYYIKAVANIYHLDKFVRFFPYPIKSMEVGSESFLKRQDGESKFGYILMGIVTVLIIGVLGHYGSKKLKHFGKRSGLEMQNFPQNNQYEAVNREENQTF